VQTRIENVALCRGIRRCPGLYHCPFQIPGDCCRVTQRRPGRIVKGKMRGIPELGIQSSRIKLKGKGIDGL
jgi:hypothetical protein